jgi:hypothetical protein
MLSSPPPVNTSVIGEPGVIAGGTVKIPAPLNHAVPEVYGRMLTLPGTGGDVYCHLLQPWQLTHTQIGL